MRKQLIKTVLDAMSRDSRVVLFLGDIGVYGFREAFERFPERVFNIGILEQASTGVASGLAIEGLIPIFFTIAPFLVERALEQIKIDFGYQQLGGNFISVGASYDYSDLGCTHHCPGNVQALKTIPGMQIVVPGHPEEFDACFRQMYDNGKPTYYRLSERSNERARTSGSIRPGSRGTVIVFGPMLDRVNEACLDLNVTISYHPSLEHMEPFVTFLGASTKIVVVEPFYEGTMVYDVQKNIQGPVEITSIGVPRRFLTTYGTPEELDEECQLTTEHIRRRIVKAFNL